MTRSRATDAPEPCQVREEAALREFAGAPRGSLVGARGRGTGHRAAHNGGCTVTLSPRASPSPRRPGAPAPVALPRVSALYRTYRPQDLSEVVGQQHVVRTLRNAIEHDRVRHAYLFAGPRGTAKTSLARILAKSLNCQTADAPTGDAVPAVRVVPHDPGDDGARRDRARRRLEPRHRRHPRDPRPGRAPTRARTAQGLHPRRGALAHDRTPRTRS